SAARRAGGIGPALPRRPLVTRCRRPLRRGQDHQSIWRHLGRRVMQPIRRGAETATTIPLLEAGIWRGIVALQLTICEPCFGTRAMFQEDQDMADQNEAKTKTIGFLPIEKVQTLKGWEEYVDKSTELSALRTEAQKAKNSVRDALKERLSENGDMDFAIEGN